jgi:hypothetical protein
LNRPWQFAGGVWTPSDQTDIVEYWEPSKCEAQTWPGSLGVQDLMMGSDAGADTNDPTVNAGPPAAVDFDGNDVCGDWATKGDPGTPTDITGAITLGGVFYATQHASAPIYMSRGWGSVGSRTQYAIRTYDGFTPDRTSFLWGDEAGVLRSLDEFADTLITDAWFTFFATARWGASDNQKIWINGVNTASGTNANAMRSEDNAMFACGAYTNSFTPTWGNWLNGSLGHMFLYDGYKEDAAMQAIHNDIANNFPDYGLSTV